MSEKYSDFVSMHGSEACERFFGMARQINSDFNYSELLQLVPKISQCAKALRTKNIILEKEKSVYEGYHFDYNIGNINVSKLMTLCIWPLDTDITSTIKTSYKLASDLAKALDMNSTPNEKSLQPFILIEEQNLEVSTGIELSSDNPDEFFKIDKEVSNVISQASKHTTNMIDNVFNFSNIENENINDQNYQQQIISTLNNTTRIFQQLTSHDFSINRYLLPIGKLDYSTMIALQKHHEAYNSRPVERQNHTHAINHEQTNTINPNKATNLANLQQNELSKRKRIDKVASETNITQDFPLQQNDYVIVLYGKKICIGKVIAMYYESYDNHCYSQNAVTQIEDLSYILLQIYLPIHLNIFASQTVKGYTLFTHHCPQNIIYHIKSNGLIISDKKTKKDKLIDDLSKNWIYTEWRLSFIDAGRISTEWINRTIEAKTKEDICCDKLQRLNQGKLDFLFNMVKISSDQNTFLVKKKSDNLFVSFYDDKPLRLDEEIV
ncbi:hypothetical protein GLOIN_2v1779586 [Rhizophagus irregularis DAOM 181602=DAOM 197198]|nr:hypothetical protein GLOIN_2v1779586 [Rhizophagus irregularis DAOM 181602=DAOM 197198]